MARGTFSWYQDSSARHRQGWYRDPWERHRPDDHPRAERVQEIIDAGLTLEKLETAMYAEALRSGILGGLRTEQLAYFQSALSAEFFHAQLFAGLGARSPFNQFFFPRGTFSSAGAFLRLALQVEETGIGAVLATIYQFALGRRSPRLSLLAGELMGVEGEHRALLRETLNLIPADNWCVERVISTSVLEVAQQLQPFLGPNRFNGGSTGPVPFPSRETVELLADDHACFNPNTGER